MRTANPILSDRVFSRAPRALSDSDAMTLMGAVNATGILLSLCFLAAMGAWYLAVTGNPLVGLLLPVGSFGGLITVVVTAFRKEWAPVIAPIYAVLEGLLLGGVSLFFERLYPGIVVQAVGLTFGTLFGLLLAYKSGLIRATENFKLGVVAATMGIAAYYVLAWLLSYFGVQAPLIWDSGPWGIGFTALVLVVAALNLVLDFDFIEQGAEMGLPRYMEWFAALGLMVTLVWLYIEFLRLLSKLRER